jgi:hypothetical protein
MVTTMRIVLTTSDIQKREFTDDGIPGAYKATGSTGLLELALEKGLEVFITTTRSKIVGTDKWWLGLVPEDHIFFADPSIEDQEEQLASGWKKCVAALGLTWPTKGETEPELAKRLGTNWAAKPGHWADVQAWLTRQGVANRFYLAE